MTMKGYLAEPRRLRYRRIALLLGAGASYDHGCPLVGEFLSPQYFRWLCDQCAALPAPHLGPENSLEYFLAAVDQYQTVAENFEEVLSKLYAQPDLYTELLEFVYRVLATAHGITLVSSQLGSTVEYLSLATMILEHPEAEGVSVITFNYDTVIEAAISSISSLVAKHWPAERLFFDYGFRQPVLSAISPEKLNWVSYLPNVYPAGRVPILKPHGSINMLRCSACAAVVYFPFQAFKYEGGIPISDACPACSAGPLRPLIVPPGKRKTLPPALEQVWLAAEFAFEASDIVVIMGYSMPEYDIEARDLLERTLRDKIVLLVDPRPSPDAVKFLRGISGAEVEVLTATATSFLQSEMDWYDPRLSVRFNQLSPRVYLDQHLLQGYPRTAPPTA